MEERVAEPDRRRSDGRLDPRLRVELSDLASEDLETGSFEISGRNVSVEDENFGERNSFQHFCLKTKLRTGTKFRPKNASESNCVVVCYQQKRRNILRPSSSRDKTAKFFSEDFSKSPRVRPRLCPIGSKNKPGKFAAIFCQLTPCTKEAI